MSAPTADPPRHGGRLLVEQLARNGCQRVFLVPGESFLPVLDALHDAAGVATVVCRQEGGAAMMAEAHGKLSGAPGVCVVSRGPGATNASAGIHVAQQDSTPLILLVGQVPRSMLGREAFQEVDLVQFFAPLAKWAVQVEDAERIPEYVNQAYQRATAGRPGPVVLVLPEDLLSRTVTAGAAPAYLPTTVRCATGDVEAAAALLADAERPLVLVGGPGWGQATADALAGWAERAAVPLAATFRCQDYVDNDHPCYVGDVGLGINPALAERVRQADVILALGARLGEATTSGYTLLTPPRPRQRLVHVHPDPNELGRVYRPELAVAAGSADFVARLADGTPGGAERRRGWLEAARADYEAWTQPQTTPGECRLEDVVAHLGAVLPADAIITNGAGNYAAWVHRYHRYRRYGTQLAPRCGSMGYGLPAAVAAKLAHPERTVVCFAGDGCFLMHGQELATAVQYGAGILVIVANNAMYGTIRMHQERRFPGRPIATGLRNPDFAALAESYGALGLTVRRSEEFPAALEAALGADGPALIELSTDPRAITPRQTLAELGAGR